MQTFKYHIRTVMYSFCCSHEIIDLSIALYGTRKQSNFGFIYSALRIRNCVFQQQSNKPQFVNTLLRQDKPFCFISFVQNDISLIYVDSVQIQVQTRFDIITKPLHQFTLQSSKFSQILTFDSDTMCPAQQALYCENKQIWVWPPLLNGTSYSWFTWSDAMNIFARKYVTVTLQMSRRSARRGTSLNCLKVSIQRYVPSNYKSAILVPQVTAKNPNTKMQLHSY